MAHDAFISYSTKDKATADAVCATLESNGIRCWIAPRDVLPGMNWAGAIIDALHHARVLILVFSTNSNGSSQVMQEVERAASNGIPILPLRIEDVLPSNAMEYFLGSRHWLDAMTPPLEAHLQRLARTVRLLLDQAESPGGEANPSGSGGFAVAAPSGVAAAAPPRTAPSPRRRGLLSSPARGSLRWAIGGVVTLALTAAIAFGARTLFQGSSLSPAELYHALLASPIVESELPAGFTSPLPPYGVNDQLSAPERLAHAAGAVRYDVTGSDWRDSATYVAFPTAADAQRGFDQYSKGSTPAGFTVPVKCISESSALDDQELGQTICAGLTGNATVAAQSIVLGQGQSQGSMANATALLKLALAHLQRVGASPPRPLSKAAPPGSAPAPAPLAELPPTVSVVAGDAGASAKANETSTDLRAILAVLEADFGLRESRTWRLHLFSDEATARQAMSQLGFAPADIDSFFSSRMGERDTYGSSDDSVLFLPDVFDLRGDLGYMAADYTLLNFGGVEGKEVYPAWLQAGLPWYVQTQFSQSGLGYHFEAIVDSLTGAAPSLSALEQLSDLRAYMAQDPQNLHHLTVRGAAAIDFIAERYSRSALYAIVNGDALGSPQKFNELLQTNTSLTPDQLDTALDRWLKGGAANPAAGQTCRGWTGSWSSSFGSMQTAVTAGALTGTYTYGSIQRGAVQGKLSGSVVGDTAKGTWTESPTFQPPAQGGDFQFVLSTDGGTFTGQWRYGSSGDWMTWTGNCLGKAVNSGG